MAMLTTVNPATGEDLETYDIMSRDEALAVLATAHRAWRDWRLESGTVFVNSFVKSDPRMPFGGVKKSGLGRELARFGLREFTNIQGVNVYAHDG